MSFDKIFDLTASWSVFSTFIIYIYTPPTKRHSDFLQRMDVSWLLDTTRKDGPKNILIVYSRIFLFARKGPSNDHVEVARKGRRISGLTAGGWFRNRRLSLKKRWGCYRVERFVCGHHTVTALTDNHSKDENMRWADDAANGSYRRRYREEGGSLPYRWLVSKSSLSIVR